MHPSIGNYFMVTMSQIFTNNDGSCGTFTGDDVTKHLDAAGSKAIHNFGK
jgi:hypothetical protein